MKKEMAQAQDIFLGYRIKIPCQSGNQIVCAVGDEMTEPAESQENWTFNRAYCYNTPQIAWAASNDFESGRVLFAYFLTPMLFDADGSTEPTTIAETFVEGLPEPPESAPDLTGFKFLGYDVVEIQTGVLGFGYSPLTSSAYPEFTTNHYGLLDDKDEAIRACRFVEVESAPHGPHYVVGVWAQQSTLDTFELMAGSLIP